MTKLILTSGLMVLLGLAGCTSSSVSVGCTIEGGVDSILAPAIATGLSCTNTAAITASLQQAGSKVGLCVTATPALKTGVPTILCQALADSLIQVLGTQVPAAWSCSPTAAISTLTTLVNAQCAKLAPAPSPTPSPSPVASPLKKLHKKK